MSGLVNSAFLSTIGLERLSWKDFALTCEAWFQLIDKTGDDERQRIPRARLILAQLFHQVLALGINYAEQKVGDDDLEVEGLSYDLIRDRARARFPNLGLYRHVISKDIASDDAVLTGDAIDDIVDIYMNLKEGHAYWLTGRKADAIWFWQHSFIYHWAEHLLDLQRLLWEIDAPSGNDPDVQKSVPEP